MPQKGFHGLFDPFGRTARQDFRGASSEGPRRVSDVLWLSVDFAEGSGRTSIVSNDDVFIGFAGDLFNTDDLCRALSLPYDSEVGTVLLGCVVAWPAEWLRRLDGQFAILVSQRTVPRVELACDVSGAYSVYYCRDRWGRVGFATRLHDLFRLPDVQARVSNRSLHEYFRFLDIAAPNTIYEDIYALRSGIRLVCNKDGLSTESMEDPVGKAQCRDFTAAVDRIDDLLNASVARRLKSASRPAAFLSGGVDSGLMCAIASRVCPEIEAVTVGFEGGGFDETPVAAEIAHGLKLEHRVLRFSRADCLEAFDVFCRDAEQPMADPAATPTLLAFRFCRNSYDTVLDGTGADELVGAMPPRHMRIAVEYASLLPGFVRRMAMEGLKRVPKAAAYARIFDFEHPAEMLIRWRGFSLVELSELYGQKVSLEHTHFFRTFSRFRRSAHYERYSALLAALPCDRLHQAARMTGLAVRYPYLEHELVEFFKPLPVTYLHAQDAPKRILREVLARYLPRFAWDHPKHGFDFPLVDFLSGDDCLIVRRHLARARWEARGLLDPVRIEAIAKRFAAGEHQLAFRVLALAVLDLWLDSHESTRN